VDRSERDLNEPFELAIDALAAGGEGVGRDADGRVVFVPFAAPGDRLRVRIVEAHARFARAEIESILEPGPVRVTPPCPVFGRCGGCAWQHVDYAAQVEAKRAILRDALVRIGGLADPPLHFVASPAAYGYRGRARLLAADGAIGFRARRSHAVCAIASCPLLAPPLDAALAALAARPPAEPGEWELALGSDGTTRTAPIPAASGERIAIAAAGERVEVSPGVFAQANALLLDALANEVVAAAGEGTELLELFAGAGFFTLALARRFGRATAVESDARAVADLAHNARASGVRHLRVVEAASETVLADAAAHRVAPDVVVLDPPRGGIGPRASGHLARLPVRRVVHVSCDPATLARDLAVLTRRGFEVERITGLDLFPQTPHVEAVAVLARARPPRRG
jgi:23S rRNA (uracil1939-C5)-methyltransferase